MNRVLQLVPTTSLFRAVWWDISRGVGVSGPTFLVVPTPLT